MGALPRRLPISVPPAPHEIVASYLARLATLNSHDGDQLWRRISTPGPDSRPPHRQRRPARCADRTTRIAPGRRAAGTARPGTGLADVPARTPDRMPPLRCSPPRRRRAAHLGAPPLRLHPARVLDRPARRQPSLPVARILPRGCRSPAPATAPRSTLWMGRRLRRGPDRAHDARIGGATPTPPAAKSCTKYFGPPAASSSYPKTPSCIPSARRSCSPASTPKLSPSHP